MPRNVIDILPSSNPRNPELVEQMQGAALAVPETREAATALAKVPVTEEATPRKIRVSTHVTAERHYLIRRGAAELNMSVDTFVAESIDAALRGLALLR